MSRRSVCKAKDKIKIKTYSLWIVNWKLKSKIYKLGEGDGKIPIPHLARPRSKKINENGTKIWIEENGFKSGIRLKIRLENSRNILGQLWSKLWSTARYAPHSDKSDTNQKTEFPQKTRTLDLNTKIQK